MPFEEMCLAEASRQFLKNNTIIQLIYSILILLEK